MTSAAPRDHGLSALSRDTGVPVATIKFYLREGLLPPGEKISARQALYGENHRRRLRLIRALVDVRGLTLKQTAEALSAIDTFSDNLHIAVGFAIGAIASDAPVASGSFPDAKVLDGTAERDEPDADLVAAEEFLAGLGWRIHQGSPNTRALAEVMATLRRMHPDIDAADLLRPYAEAMRTIVPTEIEGNAAGRDALEHVERAVVVTLLVDAALTPLRHLAQEEASRVFFQGGR